MAEIPLWVLWLLSAFLATVGVGAGVIGRVLYDLKCSDGTIALAYGTGIASLLLAAGCVIRAVVG